MLLIHGDDDQLVRFDDSALLSAQFAVLGCAITSMETETCRPARLILLGEDPSPLADRFASDLPRDARYPDHAGECLDR